MTHKKTVTIGIPAHNESATILRLLGQLVSQHSHNYILEKIIVACDGCTDNTAALVTEYARTHSVVRLIDDGLRKGKSGRLASFYQKNTSDVFISLDADVELGNFNVIDALVACFASSSVGLVGGYDLPHRGRTFVERVISAGIDIWFYTRMNINGGDSVHNHHGCVSALSYSFCRTVEFDTSIVSDDEYLYLRAKELGYSFVFCKEAPVYYSVPATLSDYFKQSARFMGFKSSLEEKMGSWINAYYAVPRSSKIIGLLHAFVRDPIHVPFAIVLQLYTHFIAVNHLEKNITGGNWTTIASTKR